MGMFICKCHYRKYIIQGIFKFIFVEFCKPSNNLYSFFLIRTWPIKRISDFLWYMVKSFVEWIMEFHFQAWCKGHSVSVCRRPYLHECSVISGVMKRLNSHLDYYHTTIERVAKEPVIWNSKAGSKSGFPLFYFMDSDKFTSKFKLSEDFDTKSGQQFSAFIWLKSLLFPTWVEEISPFWQKKKIPALAVCFFNQGLDWTKDLPKRFLSW